MDKNLRIGILGGSFDPVHHGHLQLAQAALVKAQLDCVLLLVAKDPPHKAVCTPAWDRLQMVRLACARAPGLVACGLELELPGRVYAIHAVRELKRRLPTARFFYLLGSDTLATLPHWYGGRELLSSVDILCAVRKGGWGPDARQAAQLGEQFQMRLTLLDLQLPDISSTQIRERLAAGLSISQLVEPAVEHYILAHGLYRPQPHKSPL